MIKIKTTILLLVDVIQNAKKIKKEIINLNAKRKNNKRYV